MKKKIMKEEGDQKYNKYEKWIVILSIILGIVFYMVFLLHLFLYKMGVLK